MSLHFQEVGKTLILKLSSLEIEGNNMAVCSTLTLDSMESTAVVLPWTGIEQLKYMNGSSAGQPVGPFGHFVRPVGHSAGRQSEITAETQCNWKWVMFYSKGQFPLRWNSPCV